MIPHVLKSTIKYLSSNYSTESLNLVFPASVPYNWKSPIGYAITIFLQFSSIFSAVVIFACVLTLFFAFRQFLLALVADLRQNVYSIDQIIRENSSNQNSMRVELKERFHEMIQFHADAKKYENCHRSRLILIFYGFSGSLPISLIFIVQRFFFTFPILQSTSVAIYCKFIG